MSPYRETGERALPGGSSLFWKSEPKSTRGSHPWTPFYLSARKDTFFLLSSPSVPAIELLNRQSLRRNYESALKLGFCGDITCGNCIGPFLPDHLPRPGYSLFPVQQLQEAAVTIPLKASWHSLSGWYYGVQGQCPWRFPSAFQKADSRPEGHEPRIGYALLPIKRYMARHRQTPF